MSHFSDMGSGRLWPKAASPGQKYFYRKFPVFSADGKCNITAYSGVAGEISDGKKITERQKWVYSMSKNIDVSLVSGHTLPPPSKRECCARYYYEDAVSKKRYPHFKVKMKNKNFKKGLPSANCVVCVWI